ncbi:hypothetical protein [Nocardioides sp. 1609]|uniref:hypothetical protein n=1 Tax=Nocardioides sp. 1609 TaxID=2508327 RepID=UPI00106F4393|nr:hypothetical protein [Nocardioides sp. 1609]
MSARARAAVFVVVVAVVVVSVGSFVLTQAATHGERFSAPPDLPTTPLADVADGPRLVFRHTGVDDHYGLVAVVPLDDPGGPRAFTDVACDRVAASAGPAPVVSCLRAERGLVPRFDQVLLDAAWGETEQHPLRGIPSRTRLSPDGSLVSSTSFVSGHSYLQAGFSTVTEIHEVGGESLGNLERFDLVVDGSTTTARDRNIWGVTFMDDDTFYATAATGGRTYLVRGDLGARTLTAVRENAECPSLSPGGGQVAYKVAGAGGRPDSHWTIGVLDLATGTERLLTGQRATIDDQVEWLDDDTLLYGLPRSDEAGVTDVWSLDVDPDAEPRLLVADAWSPAVVRP